ncbi:MAG: cysteine--tRNA ligase [Gemmatimonadota bacterium]
MSLQVFNTLSRRVEEFAPQVAGRVSMYTCGPTVWNYAHIGNFRTFLFEDLLRRWLEQSGYEVLHIMNLTDVDDRIIREAAARGTSIREFTEPFAQAFHEDREYLRIRPAHDYPRATDYIAPMIRLVERLLASGVAYRGEDGSVYFAIAKFPAYGELSQLDRRELKTGASERVSADEYAKEDARDFVLWKAARPEDEAVGAAWDAPFGRGRPGWHLECSAMALDLLAERWGTDVLDIHAGGVDLIFPHHEDEIAQSCAFTGRPQFARYWLHAEFLNVQGAKMSKRFGNVTTPRDLRTDGVDPGAIRLLMFQAHYRQKFDLTDEALGAAARGSQRIGEFGERLRQYTKTNGGSSNALASAAVDFRSAFAREMDADLNAPQAIGRLFDFITEGNRLMDQGAGGAAAALDAFAYAMGVLDVEPAPKARAILSTTHSETAERPAEEPPAAGGNREAWALAWAGVRRSEKNRRNFSEADRIRDLLKSHGYEIRDNKDGTMEVRSIRQG